ncbi:MAG TPA: hypothetical protein VKB80_33890, partial [Kofleriaceae bacterium]|nr:hypothetical protein [Kofleriaceae bacterium]
MVARIARGSLIHVAVVSAALAGCASEEPPGASTDPSSAVDGDQLAGLARAEATTPAPRESGGDTQGD